MKGAMSDKTRRQHDGTKGKKTTDGGMEEREAVRRV